MGNILGSASDGISAIYLSENDPELVRESLPTNMKLIELLIHQSPNNPELLTAACQAFTVYAYSFVLRDAEIAMDEDFSSARKLYSRSGNLLKRAKDYGMKALDASYPGFIKSYNSDPKIALSKTNESNISTLYWTAAAWGLFVSVSKDNPAAIIELPNIGHLLERALELDEDYDNGSIHDLMFTYTLNRPDGGSSSLEVAKEHFDRAMDLSEGSRASLYVSYAESISIPNQNKEEFFNLLDQALAVDVNEIPNQRLANILAQERANWLKSRVDELFY
ncbi:MAG: TRAP transporter TatT component family protein [Candidatus Neomarinimicrobiota bacterium]